MPELLGYLLLFTGVGVAFILVNLSVGKLIRPAKMNAEKATIYECGEPTIGSAWIQFDLRYYVVALLFVVFDVEVAFFFPWAVVFGQANELARDVPEERRMVIAKEFAFSGVPPLQSEQYGFRKGPAAEKPSHDVVSPEAARSFAWLSMIDIAIFFG